MPRTNLGSAAGLPAGTQTPIRLPGYADHELRIETAHVRTGRSVLDVKPTPER
jgi:hypothetical protein